MSNGLRISGCLGLATALLCAGPVSGVGWAQQREFPAPVHPDTLPTLIQAWFLPASLAPYVTNTYAPRTTLSGALLYIYDHHGRRLAAVDALTGKVRWHAPVPSASDRAFAFTPLLYRDRIYMASDGHLFCFDALSGKLNWEVPTKGLPVNGLGRSKHRLFLPWIRVRGTKVDPGVNIWAMDTRRGRVEWSKKFPGQMAYLTGDSAAAYYVGNTGVVLALTPDRGDPIWQVRIRGRVSSPPILNRGRLYITSLRRKAGWQGTGIYVIDTKKGKLLWQSKLPSTRISKFLVGANLATVEDSGRLTVFNAAGKKEAELTLRFIDEPTSLSGVAVEDRVFVFSHHPDGHGYIWLVDMKKKQVLTAANALDTGVLSMVPAAKMLFIDGADGNLYAYRLDRSQRPKRPSVPPEEFARELMDRVKETKVPLPALAQKLAGLGAKALPAIEPFLDAANPHVISAAAKAIGFIGNRRSVTALLAAVKRLEGTAPPQGAEVDPLLAVLEAIAEIKDGRAVAPLQKLLKEEGQGHRRRRGAYVSLGAIGTPVSLAPINAFRAANLITAKKWEPLPYTQSYSFKVEQDVEVSPETWPESIRKETTLTIQNKAGDVYTAALSPYLGGYNDVWIGKSNLDGIITQPIFTGLTVPETRPDRRIRLKKLRVSEKNIATLTIQMKQKDKLVTAKPVEISLRDLLGDYDGDKLPDLVERRLNTCVTNPDCDGDGIEDLEDLNPLASSKQKLSLEQELFREAFFTYFSFLKRRGLVIVDLGELPSFELYGRHDPVLSLRRPTIERFRKEVGLHAVDYVTFGGPYPEGGGSGDALPDVIYNPRKTEATLGLDILRSGENAVAFNVTLRKTGRAWMVTRFERVWGTD